MRVMTRQRILIVALVVSAGAAFLLFRHYAESIKAPSITRPSPGSTDTLQVPPSTAPAPVQTAAAAPDVTPETTPRPLKRGQLNMSKGQQIPEIFPHQAERDAIQTLASTYDPKVIPEIAAYLKHSDETVRAAALNALIQIGHADAVPYLKSAVAKAQGDEADRLRETIEFLSLPAAKIGQ